MQHYVIALDQGTTSSRALLVDELGRVCDISQRTFPQHFPQPGWVEHDPRDILGTQLSVLTDLMARNSLSSANIRSIGITNQRETTIVWDRHTGEPVYNAIVWQCRRTAPLVQRLCSDAQVAERITRVTGLVPDAYFSASKIAWILDNVPGARQRAEDGDLLFGTVDSWLVWHLSGGTVHATDVTNASRTMLYDIHAGRWDKGMCELFGIPSAMLPEVRPSSGFFAETAHNSVVAGVPITGIAGDQQAALFGQCCFDAGQAKNTYGTGCFLLMHTGSTAVRSRNRLITTVAASAPGTTGLEYALEGSVFTAGALIQWLVDGIGLVSSVDEVEPLCRRVADTQGVFVVPAFSGLGAPYWDSDARGAFWGLTRGVTKAHLVRACVESLAFQVNDLLAGMTDDSGLDINVLNVDGGASNNDFMLQFQSDLSAIPVQRPAQVESTALGAAYLAGLSSGFWHNTDELHQIRALDKRFSPTFDASQRENLLKGWHDCVHRTRSS